MNRVPAARSAAAAGLSGCADCAFGSGRQQAAEQNPQARLLLTQPGVGPITALAFVLTIGDVTRFARSKQVTSYVGLIPREHSSGRRQRLGAITKQGNVFLRMLLVEAAQSVVRLDEGFRKQYAHRCHSKPKGIAKVAAAQATVRLYWMLRRNAVSGDRSYREQPAGAPGQRKRLDRCVAWALSHPDPPVQKTRCALGKR